jgi:tRNA pseudouridine55 synthase
LAKGSYLQKYLNTHGVEQKLQLPFVKATPEQKIIFEEGKVLIIDKPLHWTSFDVIRKMRSALGIKKIGHAGTLDPLATGVLIICTGKYTKKINEYMAASKTYTGSIFLGATTPTYDRESNAENHVAIEHITEQQIVENTHQFIGAIEQFPPVYSAIKKDGEALYELARRGEEVELKARPITIHSFTITAIELPLVHFEVACSTGTYIRSLAHDFGKALKVGGYLHRLRRTKVGDFNVEQGQTLLQFFESLQ